MNQITIEKAIDEISFSLSGGGSSYYDCQTMKWRAHKHNESGEWHAQQHIKSCHRFQCPKCDVDWRKREKMNIFDRLSYYANVTGRAIVHYIASPKPRIVDRVRDYRSLRREGYRILRRSGIKGGVAIFHYFRHPSTLNHREDIEADNPHWHILGDGWNDITLFHADDVIKDELGHPYIVKDDWAVKRVGIRRSAGQLIRTIDYCLYWSSQGELANKPTHPEIATWFGTMSLQNPIFKNFAKTVGDGIYCPICDSVIPKKYWYEVNWLHGDPPEHVAKAFPGDIEIVLFYEH